MRSKRIWCVVVSLLMFALLAGCMPFAGGKKSLLTVNIVNLAGKPIIATVGLVRLADNQSVATQQSSTAVFTDLARGQYKISAVSERGVAGEMTVSLAKDAESYTLKLNEAGNLPSDLRVNVVDKYQHAVNATVKLINPETGAVLLTKTGATVVFAQIPAGSYRLAATLSSTGETLQTTYNVVRALETVTLTFTGFASVESVQKFVFEPGEADTLTIPALGKNERVIVGVSILDFATMNGEYDPTFTNLGIKLTRTLPNAAQSGGIGAAYGKDAGKLVPLSVGNPAYIYHRPPVNNLRPMKIRSIDSTLERRAEDILKRTRTSAVRLSSTTQAFSGDYQVNDQKAFWFQDIEDNKWREINTTLVASGQYCNIFLDNSVNYFDQAAISSLISEFDGRIYPIDTGYFAKNFDIDGNNKLGIVLMNMDMTNFDGGVVMGFFNGMDFFDQQTLDTQFGSGHHTNQGDYVYLNTQVIDSGLALGYSTADLYSTIAHEFQHELWWNNSWNNGWLMKTPEEGWVDDTWITEAMATYAEQLNGYTPPVDERVYIYFDDADSVSQLTQLVDMSQVSLTYWNDDLANYGMAGLFVKYLVEQYGDKVIHDIYAKAQNPLTSISETAGMPFDELFMNFVIANKLHSLNLAPEYSYKVALEGDPADSPLATNYGAETYYFRNGAVKYYMVQGNGTDVKLQIEGAEWKRLGVFTYRY